MDYCNFCQNQPLGSLHRIYHDESYGFPIDDDDELFGRLILEINQAGLSWDTILKKENYFREAFDGFSIDKIALYGEDKINELKNNPTIVRNNLKIRAVVYNANKILELKKDYGSFKSWLSTHGNRNMDEWVRIFKKEFKFVGKEIVAEFLMSTGYFKGAHSEHCEVFHKVLLKKPNWLKYEK